MAKVNIKIEGFPYQVEDGITIMEAAKQCGYEIPSLCSFNHGECSSGSCRVCLVEASGTKGLVASCVYPVNEGMEISISSEKATKARRASVELLLSNHNPNCQHHRRPGQQVPGRAHPRHRGPADPRHHPGHLQVHPVRPVHRPLPERPRHEHHRL